MLIWRLFPIAGNETSLDYLADAISLERFIYRFDIDFVFTMSLMISVTKCVNNKRRAAGHLSPLDRQNFIMKSHSIAGYIPKQVKTYTI